MYFAEKLAKLRNSLNASEHDITKAFESAVLKNNNNKKTRVSTKGPLLYVMADTEDKRSKGQNENITRNP